MEVGGGGFILGGNGWPFDYLVTWEKKKNYICNSALPMVNKLGRVVTYGGENQLPKSRVLFIM